MRLPGHKKGRFFLVNLLLVLNSLFFTFLALELIVRALNPEDIKQQKIRKGPGQTWKPHPYFGLVYNLPVANNHGFATKYDFPYRKKDGDIVVAMLGGSAADFLASEKFQWEEKLKKEIKKFQNKNVVFINLAIGSFKQPQQFFVATKYLDFIDIFINLDGFNEIDIVKNGFKKELQDLPYLYLINSIGVRDISELPYSLKLGHFVKVFLIDVWQNTVLQKSKLYELLLVKTKRFITNKTYLYLQSDTNQLSSDSYFIRTTHAVNIWQKYTKLQHNVVKAENKRAFFFLQPNQYVKESKVLTDLEKQTAISEPDKNTSRITTGYLQLRQALADLKKQSIAAYDLSLAFRNTKETLYIDNCCHWNDLGNLLLQEKIIAVLKRELDK